MLRVPQSPVKDFNSPSALLHGLSRKRRTEAGLKKSTGGQVDARATVRVDSVKHQHNETLKTI